MADEREGLSLEELIERGEVKEVVIFKGGLTDREKKLVDLLATEGNWVVRYREALEAQTERDEYERAAAERVIAARAESVRYREALERDKLATLFRDWIHEQDFSKCGMGADECPDWPLAFELADIARAALGDEKQ